MSKKNTGLILLKALFSLGLVAWLVWRCNPTNLWLQAHALSPAALLISIILMLFQLALGGARWWLVLRALKEKLSFRDALAGYYIGTFFSQVLPGAIAGDGVRMWLARRVGMSLKAAVNSVLLERGITVLGLVFLVTYLQPYLLEKVPSLPGSWVFPALSVAGVVCVLCLCLLDRVRSRHLPRRVASGFQALAEHSRALFLRSFYGVASIALAIFSQVNLSCSVYALAWGLGLDVTLLDCLILVPPVVLIVIAPISIAGWGVRETAMVSLFALVGVPEQSALTLSILYGLVSLIGALPGGLFFLACDESIAAIRSAALLPEESRS